MPDTVTAVVLLVVGAGLLSVGAEAFAEHLSAAASGLGVSVLAFGVLLAGAEPEETVTAMLAAGRGRPELAAGNAIGANLVILTLTLGLAALLAPLTVGSTARQYAGGASAAGTLAVGVMWDGVLGRGEGTVLVLAYVAGVAWVWRRQRGLPVLGEPGETATETGARRAALLVLLGLLGMLAGGLLAVHGAERVIAAFGVAESVVGLTLLALATSAEMLALVVAAHRRGLSEVALAAAIGSVGYNATTTLGLAAWVDPLVLGRGPLLTIALVTAVLPLLVWAGRRTGRIPRPLGGLLVVAYVVAAGWLFAR